MIMTPGRTVPFPGPLSGPQSRPRPGPHSCSNAAPSRPRGADTEPAETAEPRAERRGATAAAVLGAILDEGPVARSTVARVTGLSAAAVSRRIGELKSLGLVRDRPEPARAAIGRPTVPVDVDTGRHLVCGVHIALYHWTIVLMDLRGRVLAERRTPHGDPAPDAVLDAVAEGITGFLAEHAPRHEPLGIGVATGGWVDPERGVIVRHTQLGWQDVAAGEVLELRTGLPVRVESHSRALARAEQLIGVHRERARSSLVHLFVGNVVDAAIATGSRVHQGPGSAAGDVGHLPVGGGIALPAQHCPCGRSGCVQATVADRAVAAHAAATGLLRRRLPVGLSVDAPDGSGTPAYPFAEVIAALDAGERWAWELFRDRARLVGRAVALLLDVINPELLVVVEAGIVRRPELLAELHAEIAARSHVCVDPARTVVASSFGARSVGVAAGAVVLHEVYAHPLRALPPPRRRAAPR